VRGIDQSLVDEVWRDLTSYPPDRVQAEAAAFLEQQPHVAAFARTMTREQDAGVQQAALGLCFLVFKVLDRSLGRPFPPLAEARLADAYASTRHWLDHGESADAATVLERAEAPAHPTLVTYLLAVFYGDAAGGDYDESVRASLFLLLRTLTEALDVGTPSESAEESAD
jgi:hypothetical protein